MVASDKEVAQLTSPRSTSRWADPNTYGVLAVVVMVFGFHLSFVVHHWLQVTFYRGFDTGIFDQAVRAYSRFQLPRVPIKGVYAGLGENFLQLGDHFSPIHALLAPLYWIWDDVRMLLLAQAAMYAVAAAVVWRFTRRMLGTGPAYLVALAFGVSWGLQAATDTGYHELDWAVLLLAIAIERLYAGRHPQALAAAGLLLLVKEEMGLVVAILGLLFVLRGERRWGGVLAVSGIAWSALAIKVFIPAFGGSSRQYWSYSSLGSGPGSAAKLTLTHPWRVVELAVSTPDKRQLLIWLLAVSIGACLLSPIALLALPSLALRLLSDQSNYSTVHFQYNALLMVVLLMAGVEGVARLVGWQARWRERRVGVQDTAVDRPDNQSARPRIVRTMVWTWAIAVFPVAVYGCITPLFGFSVITNPSTWHVSAYQRAAATVADKIPRGATVEADDAFAIRISRHTQHLVIVDRKPHGSQYVVLGAAPVIAWPYESRAQILKLKQDYRSHGYQQIWQQADVWLLKKDH